MVLTPSSMQTLGMIAPDFLLYEPLKDHYVSYRELKSCKGTVVCFICNHCPFVVHIQQKLANVAESYIKKGFSFIAINANDPKSYPDDAPEKMIKVAQDIYSFPYLFDKTQETAQAYGATCTPDFFIFDKDSRLIYRGQFDDARPGNKHDVTGKDVIATLDALDQNTPVPSVQRPSMGCSIKWRV